MKPICIGTIADDAQQAMTRGHFLNTDGVDKTVKRKSNVNITQRQQTATFIA